MKYIKQFFIIAQISFIGEILSWIIPLPIPGSIYGIVIMFSGLCLGIIKLSSVRETGKFLVEIMPVMFIPAAVGLINSWGLIRAAWLPYILLTFTSTIVVMGVSGRVAQAVIRKGKEANE